MPTLEQQVADLVTASNALTQTVTDKQASIDAKVAAKEAEVDAFVATTEGKAPVINLLPDSGRFAGDSHNPGDLSSGLFSIPSYLAGFNGTSGPTEVGKYIYDNSDFGGVAGAMTATTLDLLTAMGRGENLGTEFYIAEWTMGTGTSTASNGKYKTFNRNISLTGAGNVISFGMWLRAVDNDIAFGFVGASIWRDGVFIGDQIVITPADGWVHVALARELKSGIYFSWPHIYANSGDRIQIALPVIVAGYCSFGVHTSPIPTINANMSL